MSQSSQDFHSKVRKGLARLTAGERTHLDLLTYSRGCRNCRGRGMVTARGGGSPALCGDCYGVREG